MSEAKRRFNEGKALDAVLRRIEMRDDIRRGDDGHSPEREGHAAPIDYACTVGDRLFALEHTGIEPFTGQIRMGVDARKLFELVEERLIDGLPSGESFELMVPVGATVGLKRSDIERIQDTLVNWIRETAPTLRIAPIGRYILPIEKVSLEGVPFRVSLHRTEMRAGPLRGRLRVAHSVGDIEEAREERIREACDRKFPKLAAWKRDHGAHTVLVLEDADIQLTNHQVVADALSRAEAGRTDNPDEVFLVSTFLDNPWWVTCLRGAGKTYYDDDERLEEILPATLVPLTDR